MNPDTVYIVAASYVRALFTANQEMDLTGNGIGKGQGPRPWVYLSDSQSMRGRQFKKGQIVWLPGWGQGHSPIEVDEMRLGARIATRL